MERLKAHVPRWSVRAVILCLLLLFAVGTRQAHALDARRALTQAFLRKWQAPQGLPQATVLSITQTPDNQLWLGTRAGLYQFDGIRFQPGPVIEGIALEDVWIHDLAADGEGNLWLATNGSGLIRYREGVSQSVGYDGDSAALWKVMLDRSGNLWIGSETGLVRRSKEGQLTRMDESVGFTVTNVHGLCETKDGSIWVGGAGNTLLKWNGERFEPRVLINLPPTTQVTAVVADPSGTIWAGSHHGLVKLVGVEEQRLTRGNGLADDSIECLTISHEGNLWVGTRDGVSRIQGDEIESFRTRDGLSQSTALAIYEDHEGSIWVGTKHGLNQFVDRRTMPLTINEGLPSDDTGPIVQDDAGTIWIGTLGAGLARFDGRRCSLAFDQNSGLPSGMILSLSSGGDGNLWIGTDQGLSRLQADRITKTYGADEGLPAETVLSLCRDRQGTLWIGTSKGLARFQDGMIVPADHGNPVLQKPILSLMADGSAGVIAASETGVCRCTTLAVELLVQQDHRFQNVDAMLRTADGRLWLGTRDRGLLMLDQDGRVSQFTVKQGLYDDEIFGLVAETEDRLWLACSRGIFHVSRAEVLACAAGTIPRIKSNPFTPSEALRTVECQRGVQLPVYQVDDGKIWFATNQGVLIVNPAQMTRKFPPPQVIVEEMQVNGKNADLKSSLRLPPGLTNVTFRYTAATYAIPQRVGFRYMLEGFDKDWIDAGQRREAFYTNLPPNSYRFRVCAANPTMEWSEAAEPVNFIVPPYFYETTWFIALSAACLVLAAWGAYRLRMMQLRSQFLAVMAERLRIARELHDTLIQGFSGVTMQMQALANRLTANKEQQTLREVIADAGFCLREARRTVAGLRNTHGKATRLSAAITEAAQQNTHGHDLQLTLRIVDIPDLLPNEVEYNLLRIAQEAITNTVKHSGARHLEVSLQVSGRRLYLSIVDDGRGFQTDGAEVRSPGHYGLIGMRERALQIHGQLQVQSSPGRGTTVRIEIPLGKFPQHGTEWPLEVAAKDTLS
ncbi:sensor histidine kinase [Planctomicrobium piriforme]|uniref:Two component regulator propeller n=1 Tax=Planctomicrobium piriforme TaxID=1576369 RepID=A0A1I3J5L8_9PLAN|nr:sensor histidine kinase [Planctomicrobium piriforme]SFI55631.1 Two component regulator propeller [Planctomicrobium piriforme]